MKIDENSVPEGKVQNLRSSLSPMVLVAWVGLLLGIPPAACAVGWYGAPHDVAAGNLTVSQYPGWTSGDDNTNCVVALSLSVNDFRIGTYNRGDYNVQVGASATDDSANGILITSVAQNIRTQYGTNSYGTTAIDTNANGGYRITSYAHNDVGECNVNVAGAWFPYSTWLGGWARTSPYLNGGINSCFTGSPGMKTWRDGAAYTNYTDLKETQNLGGRSIVDLRNFGFNSATDGVLLVNHGKDEANHALSSVNADGTWTLFIQDNGADGGSYEQDPVAFVFIPKTTTSVVSGRVQTDSASAPTIAVYSDTTPQFTVTKVTTGRWFLKMNNADYTPTNGVLLVSWAGGGNRNLDNIVSCEPTNSSGNLGWDVQSRDLPNGGLQTPYAANNGPEDCFSFVYIPANKPGVTVTPTSNLQTTEIGGTATFTVVLDRQPYADVTIGVSSSDTTEGNASPSTLTFTALNWDMPQTVTVTGVDDTSEDGNVPYTIVLAAATSTDSRYNGLNPADVSVINADNTRVLISTTSAVVNEAGTSTDISVRLSAAPTTEVTVNFASSDLTEGTAAPAALMFTPANWSTPQTVVVAGEDDFIMDGAIQFSIVTTISSSDPVYAALNPDDIAVTTLDNEASLALASGPAVYGIGDPAVGLDGAATLADPYTSTYNGVTLTVAITSQGSADDRLAVRNDGTGMGQIGVSGNTVTYGGTTVATLDGGTGTTPLVATFNAAASPSIAQALLRAVTYRTLDPAAVASSRTVAVTLAHADGGVSSASKEIGIGVMRVYEYQAGMDHGYGVYAGAVDVQVSPSSPDTTYPAGTSVASGMWIDYVGASNPQVLLGFTNIFGTAPGQIPLGATIVSAQLSLYVNDSGHGARFFRMLKPWDANAETWNTLGGGVQQDNAESCSTNATFWGLSTTVGLVASGTGTASIGVTTDVQLWANGHTNCGWVALPWDNASNGTGWSPCEDATPANRPQLRVVWLPAGTALASFQQGVNGYAKTLDTSVRENEPNTSRAAANAFWTDWAVSLTSDNEQVLLRFDDIIGSDAGQIPAGVVLNAAVLDLTSDCDNAPGDGGLFYAMLQPWQETDAWNTLGGIQANGIKAAATPTATAGSSTLTPNVQATANTFDLTTDVQAWVNGTRANYGWAVLPWPSGTDGWGSSSAQAASVGSRPRLRVYCPTSIAGRVRKDINGNGVADVNDTNGISGVTIVLRTAGGAPVATNVTSVGGAYLFTDVVPGSYVLAETDLNGWTSTGDTDGGADNQIAVTLSSGQITNGNTFLDTPVEHWNAGAGITCSVTNAAGSPGAGYSVVNVDGYLDIQASAANPYLISLASYSGAASGLAANWNYDTPCTWTVATATAGVLSFDASKFAVETGSFANDLAGGAFAVAVSGNTVIVVFTPNRPPSAGALSYSYGKGVPFKPFNIPLATFLAENTSDPDGDPRTLISMTSTNATVSTNATNITIGSDNGLAESIAYVIRDARNYRPGDTVRTASSWINILRTNAVGGVAVSNLGGTNFTMIFHGIPGCQYVIQRSCLDLSSWIDAYTNVAAGNGRLEFTETPSEGCNPTFYRVRSE